MAARFEGKPAHTVHEAKVDYEIELAVEDTVSIARSRVDRGDRWSWQSPTAMKAWLVLWPSLCNLYDSAICFSSTGRSILLSVLAMAS